MGTSGPVRALGLCSGGLDSILSALVLKEQGIEVHWVAFETPFFPSDKAKAASRQTGIPLTVKNITQTYLEMIRSPFTKFGKNMNPCMDCHALMFRLAGEMMAEEGFDFLFSGEVLGQRPMSQNKTSLRYVEKHSGCDGTIVRPLSAKNLPETLAEKEGLVDRDQLLDLSGRGRKTQMELARKYGVKDYPAPAGGCLLTDKIFSRRLRDLLDHQPNVSEKDLVLLKVGRHFRLDSSTKIVVGRTRQDNEQIGRLLDPEKDLSLKVKDFPGPLVAMPAHAEEPSVLLAAGICVGYSKAPEDEPLDVSVQMQGASRKVMVLGIPPKASRKFMI